MCLRSTLQLLRSRWSRGGDSGFTLLELLVSLALLAAILVIIPSTIRLAARASTTSAELIAGTDNSAALNFMQQTVAEAMPLLESDEEGAVRVAFRGDARSLSFVAPLANGPAGGGLYRMRLEFAEREDNALSALQVSLSAYGQTSEAATRPLEVRQLADGLSAGEIRYFGLLDGREVPEWSSSWTRNDRLPDMVELNFSSATAAPVSLKIEPRLRRRS